MLDSSTEFALDGEPSVFAESQPDSDTFEWSMQEDVFATPETTFELSGEPESSWETEEEDETWRANPADLESYADEVDYEGEDYANAGGFDEVAPGEETELDTYHQSRRRAATPAVPGALCGAIARIAEQEFKRWRPSGTRSLTETDPGATPILQDYYRNGVGTTATAAQLQSTEFQKAHPWSAVFVSWVMRKAGAGRTFAYSAAHQNYIRAARRNRLTQNAASPFWAYRVTEVVPQVGDLVCASRANSGATYDNIADPQRRRTHCDIVTAVRPGSIRVIGGNVRQNVDEKTILTHPDGRLRLDGPQSRFFAVIKCQAGAVAPRPSPVPTPLAGVAAGKLVVKQLPLLRSHAGTPPDLVLKWNAMAQPSVVDVVVHLHGHHGGGWDIDINARKLPISGLDFADPANPAALGRTAPTLLVLPRGHHDPQTSKGYNPARYTFPALTRPGGLQQLVDEALARFAAQTGTAVRRNRLILTAHSGGGAALMQILAHTDPDEIHAFDALYNDATPLITWAKRRLVAGTGTLRVIYRPGEGTAANSEAVHRAIRAAKSPSFRVERTNVGHNDIPRRFGWRLLADASADLPGVVLAREVDAEVYDSEEYDEAATDFEDTDSEVDVERADEAATDFEDTDSEVDVERADEAATDFEDTDSEVDVERADEAATDFEDTDSEVDVERADEAATDFEDYYVMDREAASPSDVESGEVEEALLEEATDAETDSTEFESFPSGLGLTTRPSPDKPGEEHWDPHNTGLPLYDTPFDVRGKKLSTNFTVGELVSSGAVPAERARISPVLVRCLQAIRDRAGKPVKITSGYRSWKRNVEVYRPHTPKLSRHCSGQAADITIAGLSGLDIAKLAVDACGGGIGIGIGKTFAHIDVRGSWMVWAYKGVDQASVRAQLGEYRRSRGTVPVPTPGGQDVEHRRRRCGAPPSPRTPSDLDRRIRTVMQLLVDRYGYPITGAAGLVGNLIAESAVLPNRIEGSTADQPMRARDFTGRQTDFTAEQVRDRDFAAKRGPRRPGIGIAQWTHPRRRAGLFSHSFNGKVLGATILFDLDAQVDYLVTELRRGFRTVNATLTAPRVTADDASDEVVYRVERPGRVLQDGKLLPRDDPRVQQVFEQRRSHAQRALRVFRAQRP
ncbi:phage tail tip lysozyme [Rhodococcus tukisamuensis]|uniref:Peptidase M15 n=1 Tax=Rhodococcus tukisamuensis TaxID=168276 RepID=A0A1G6RFU4_9NOCA|nr:phage tail tip lysozyme [Rhodococcus tukisamuensis]SDD02766.1 Peptidase M15 [Rhodococcus tukisamuensis]